MFLCFSFSLSASMEVGQEAYAVTGLKEQNLLAKGKRTKRQRLQIAFSLISPNYPNSAEPDSELFGQRDHGDVCNFSSNGGDEEEEDMANCLILLAQGRPASERSSSSFRRFMAAAEDQNGAGKAAACCVYECKTCSRTFPSFQALGGHRTSHKKPLIKPAMAANGKSPISESSPENEEEFKNNISNPLEVRLISRSDYYNKLVNNKVHECSICGAEFMSGQALGGHMSRHRRGLGTGGGASSSASMAKEVAGEREQRPKKQRSLLSLNLDLNLPAPEDDRREQSGAIVMAAAPALVGCHY